MKKLSQIKHLIVLLLLTIAVNANAYEDNNCSLPKCQKELLQILKTGDYSKLKKINFLKL